MSDYAAAQYIIDEVSGKIKTGIPPQNMAGLSIIASDKTAKVRFTEPADTIIDNQLICSVKGVKLVLNEEHYPTDENDGLLIIDNQEYGKYSQEPLIISDLINDKPYYLAAFPYSDSGIYNRSAGLRVYDSNYAVKNRVKFTPKEYILYGFRKAKNDSEPSARIEYLEQAAGLQAAHMDFDSGTFEWGDWSNAFFLPKPYMVKSNGTLDYELNADNQSLKMDGETPSDISNPDYDGNAMAVFPTVWQYCYEDADYEYRYICDTQLDDKYTANMWTREDGSIEEWHALAMFEGSLVNNKLRSLADRAPATSATAANELTYAKANGSLWETNAFCEWDFINTILTLMGKSTDTQSIFGYGRGGASAALNTGTLKNKPMFFGYSQAQSTVNAVKVLYLENWWGNIWNRIQGLIAVNRSIRVKMQKPYNFTAADFINTGLTLASTSGGYIDKTQTDNEYGTIPYNASGSATTYECDGLWYQTNAGTYIALVGGGWNSAALCGASCVSLNYAAAGTSTTVGARLSCGQPAA